MSKLVQFITKHFGGLPSKDSWKWILRVNPESPNSFPTANEYRKTSPGNQPEYHLAKEEKLTKNYYFERDSRRNYPQTVVVTETKLLGQGSLPPIMQNRYKYTKTDTHDCTGSDTNPQFSIRMVK
jgi:hypothetical protein